MKKLGLRTGLGRPIRHLQLGQGLAHLPLDASSCCELPPVVARERQEEGTVMAGGSEVRVVET
jgi:hypothetical protein